MSKHESSNQPRMALYEDEIYTDQSKAEPEVGVVIFCLGNERYGFPVSEISTVVSASWLTIVPYTPDYVLGIINIRGRIFSVIDLKKIFGLSSEGDFKNSSIIILEEKGVAAGILTDGKVKMINFLMSDLQTKIITLQGETGDMIQGQFCHEGQLVAMLDSKKIIEKTNLGSVSSFQDL